MLDLKIVGGQIADGTGRPLYKADVGVIGGMIAAIGDLKDTESRETIDAAGKVVSPGFIDIHTHSDINMLLDPHAESALRCGVTTHVTGNCGMGVAPLSYPDRKVVKGYIDSQFNIANYVGPSMDGVRGVSGLYLRAPAPYQYGVAHRARARPHVGPGTCVPACQW